MEYVRSYHARILYLFYKRGLLAPCERTSSLLNLCPVILGYPLHPYLTIIVLNYL